MEKLLKGIDVFLIGMMGSGKTTVGAILAQQLGYHFFDSDRLIEQVTHQSINELFATLGEAEFREIESQVLGELAAYTRSVIATGGGIVLRQQNWSYLRHGLIIWLDASVNLLCQRLAEDKTRPLLQETELSLKLNSLLEQRHSLYAQADLRITIEAEQTPQEIVERILNEIPKLLISVNNNGKLRPS